LRLARSVRLERLANVGGLESRQIGEARASPGVGEASASPDLASSSSPDAGELEAHLAGRRRPKGGRRKKKKRRKIKRKGRKRKEKIKRKKL